jgi:hypothetical protein
MRPNSSWFALLLFCSVAALAVAIGFATLFTGAALAFTVGQQGDNESVLGPESAVNVGQPEQSNPSETHEASVAKTYTGMVTDSHCMGRHVRYPGKSSAECARMCARTGSPYVLIDGDKKYALRGGDLALDKVAAQRATVAGVLEGDAITVSSAGPQ